MKTTRTRCLLVSLICLLVGASFACQSSGSAPDPEPTRFRAEIEAFAHWERKNATPKNPVLFVGSSSIRLWPSADQFPQFPVVNRGFGGAHISDVVHYFDALVKKQEPIAVVFYAGDNDIAAGKSPEQVLEDFHEFTELLKRDLPTAQVLYLPIKPSLDRWKYWAAMDQANALIRSHIETHDHLHYVDVATPMLGADGKPRPVLFVADGLHLNEHGYELWRSVLDPALAAVFSEAVRAGVASDPVD